MSLEHNPLTQKKYYKFDYEVVILFGLTELKAYVTWKENVRAYHSSENDATDLGTGHRETVGRFSNCQFSPLKRSLRSEAVIVYDD